jgi:hypothetical protein
MSTNLNPAENHFLFSYQIENRDDTGLPLLLPRSAWGHQVNYLKVLFRAKKKLDQIDAVSTYPG